MRPTSKIRQPRRPPEVGAFFELEFGEIDESEAAFFGRSRIEWRPVSGYLPDLACPKCGPWGEPNGNLYGPKVDALLKKGDLPRAVSISEWPTFAKALARHLGVDASDVTPGRRLGHPRGKALAAALGPVLSPGHFFFWFSQSVVDEIGKAGLTGCRFHPVEWVGPRQPTERYYELQATGHALHDASPRSIVRCKTCGRITKLVGADAHTVSLASWSGDDFFMLEGMASTMVTERALSLLQRRSEHISGVPLTAV